VTICILSGSSVTIGVVMGSILRRDGRAAIGIRTRSAPVDLRGALLSDGSRSP